LVYCILILCAALAFSGAGPALAAGVSMTLDGNLITFTDQQPFIDSVTGRTMIPLRAVAENLGAQVSWDGKDTATITKNGLTITMKVGSNCSVVNGVEKYLDAPAVICEDRTFVPVRFISEAMNTNVTWDQSNYCIEITTKSTANSPESTSVSTTTSSEPTVTVSGKSVVFTGPRPQYGPNQEIYLPLTDVVVAMGGTYWFGYSHGQLQYNDASHPTVSLNGLFANIVVGSKVAKFDTGESRYLDAPAVLVNGCEMVPLSFFSETLNAQVEWNNSSKVVNIIPRTNNSTQEDVPSEFKIIANTVRGAHISISPSWYPRLIYYGNGKQDSPFDCVGHIWAEKSDNRTFFAICRRDNQTFSDLKQMLRAYFPSEYEQAYALVVQYQTEKIETHDVQIENKKFSCMNNNGGIDIRIEE